MVKGQFWRPFLLLLWLGVPTAWAGTITLPLPPAVHTAEPGLHLLGAGSLYWLWFHAYDAALYVDGPGYAPQKRPYALVIRYDRDFSSHELAKTSLKEIDRLDHPSPAERERFAHELADAFPSVHSGQTLVGLCIPGKETRFYFNGKPYSQIHNPAFGPAFFAIWLDPQTKVPGLRRKLLGHDTH